jgi:hypothetical protein
VSDLEVGAGVRRGGGSVRLARGGVRADEPYWVGGLGGVGAGRRLDCVKEGGDFVGGPRGTVGKGRYAHGELPLIEVNSVENVNGFRGDRKLYEYSLLLKNRLAVGQC